nr:helix-turn-helix transcriptional regulator [Kibdelosporangium sp. MJ126-NF4]
MRALREIRMDAARRLLRDPARPVTQIALTVGYSSTAAFSRAFSAHHGVAPQEWRNVPRAGDAQQPESEARGEREHGSDKQRGADARPVDHRAADGRADCYGHLESHDLQ